METMTNGETEDEGFVAASDASRANQEKILANQEKILANQKKLEANQKKLDKVIAKAIRPLRVAK